MSLSERLAIAMDHAGLSQAALARACKVAPPSVNGWLSGKSKFLRGENLLCAAAALGVRQQWLATGDGPMLPSKDERPTPAVASEYLPGFESLSIPLLANSGSMGVGEDQLHDEVVVGRLTVSPQWVERTIKSLTAPANLRFIHGFGDSMDPTFSDGDILLVDIGVSTVRIDGIYVLEANDRVYIKRVRQRMDGEFEVSSDNSTVKTVDVLDGRRPVRICGRVVWCWNGKKI